MNLWPITFLVLAGCCAFLIPKAMNGDPVIIAQLAFCSVLALFSAAMSLKK